MPTSEEPKPESIDPVVRSLRSLDETIKTQDADKWASPRDREPRVYCIEPELKVIKGNWMNRFRIWLFYKLIRIATQINPFAVVVCNYPKDNLLHDFTVVFRGNVKGKYLSKPRIEAYYDGEKI